MVKGERPVTCCHAVYSARSVLKLKTKRGSKQDSGKNSGDNSGGRTADVFGGLCLAVTGDLGRLDGGTLRVRGGAGGPGGRRSVCLRPRQGGVGIHTQAAVWLYSHLVLVL